jgi:hypothetical protein
LRLGPNGYRPGTGIARGLAHLPVGDQAVLFLVCRQEVINGLEAGIVIGFQRISPPMCVSARRYHL